MAQVSARGVDDGLWKASRFNLYVQDADGGILLYNSYSGSLARVACAEAPELKEAVHRGLHGLPKGLFATLALEGFFVPQQTDELGLAGDLHALQFAASDVLQLILMPHENCNFRCVYCYESFARGKMKRSVVEGIVRYVHSVINDLRLLRIGWFGGEPLLALDIIKEISGRLQVACTTANVAYASSMTTNGYLLTPEVRDILFRCNIRRFQVTLDGPKEEHDRLRVLANGRTGTYDRILDNLISMHESSDIFRVVVRVNFDRKSVNVLGSFVQTLKEHFGEDARFSIDFHPIGRWGGRNDSAIDAYDSVSGRSKGLDLAHLTVAAGFDAIALRNSLRPFGSVCYAANPYSYVVGTDGTVYKCTVAFDDPANQVGRITPQGELLIDRDKVRMWVANGEENDPACQACSFRPICQGNACPLARINHGHAVCPSTALDIVEAIQILQTEAAGSRRAASVS